MSTIAGLRTLAVDIGGTNIKVLVLDEAGGLLSERTRLPTPQPAKPEPMIDIIVKLAAEHPPFDRVSVGFPGVVQHGVVRTAPNLDPDWCGFNCDKALEDRLGKPVRVCNDADMQGFGAISGEGLEMVITLGTGMGSALFVDGILVPNLELAHHPFAEGKTYEQWLGDKSLKALGEPLWKEWLAKAVVQMRHTFNFDVLYLGGGNARLLDATKYYPDVRLVDNIAGLLGGIALWTDVHGTSLHRAPHSTGAHSMLVPGAGGAW
ncbi:MAG: chromosome partitioning protein ParA [Planctomycetales bacterium 12-60-4]|nr:MAG: chromosome partitioning protein ParA [Planctomycetales bacterium 12-60-4]